MIEPRIGISWRPIPASTVVIRAGYGIYPDTSVYQNIILQMAQQAPLSTSQSVRKQRRVPADAGQWICAMRRRHQRNLRHRSELPHWLCAEVAIAGAARSALRLQMRRLISAPRARTARRRFCPTAIRWARPIRVRAARRDLCTKLRAAIPSAMPGSSSCGAGCAADLPRR